MQGDAIGRYQSEVASSGPSGSLELPIDTNAMPMPTGFVGVNAGETWCFQAWHRDFLTTGPTSNFTTGLRVTFN